MFCWILIKKTSLKFETKFKTFPYSHIYEMSVEKLGVLSILQWVYGVQIKDVEPGDKKVFASSKEYDLFVSALCQM